MGEGIKLSHKVKIEEDEGGDVKVVMRFNRGWVRKAVDAGKVINVSMLPECASLMLQPRPRMQLLTGAPTPTHDEVVAYLLRFAPGMLELYLRPPFVEVEGAGWLSIIITRTAALLGVEPYDVAQDMCVGVPTSDTEFHDYIEKAKSEGVEYIDPRVLIFSAIGNGDLGDE